MGVKDDHVRHSKKVTRGARWQTLRMAVLERDGDRCVTCGARGRLEVDHVKPVRTHPELSYDPDNLQSLCPACHTRKTRIECGHKPKAPARVAWDMAVRSMERQPSSPRFSIPRGLARSLVPVNLVYGPPGAGKSSYVAAHARPDDMIIDFHSYLAAHGGKPWESAPELVRAAFAEHDADLRSLAERKRGVAWLVKLAPSVAERTAWKLALRHVREIPILTDHATCIARIRADRTREAGTEKMIAAVTDWWRTFTADHGTT